MDYFSQKDLSTFFERNINHYVSSSGMEIGFIHDLGVWTLLNVGDNEDSTLHVSIYTEGDSLNDFIVGFKIESWRDIDQLDYNDSWMRYLNCDAEIIITLLELEADISFKIVKFKTIVFSMDLHFYDETPKHLTMHEDFYKYINDHEKRLWAAHANRY